MWIFSTVCFQIHWIDSEALLCCYNLSSVCLLHFNNLTFLLLCNILSFKKLRMMLGCLSVCIGSLEL